MKELLIKSISIAEQGPEAVKGYYTQVPKVQYTIDELFEMRKLACQQIEKWFEEKDRLDLLIDRLEQGR